jgi:hypothetical protein
LVRLAGGLIVTKARDRASVEGSGSPGTGAARAGCGLEAARASRQDKTTSKAKT